MKTGTVVVLLALVLSPIPLCAQETEPEEAPAAGEEPVAKYEDVLFVEERSPFIPTSNTIATKLPQPLLLTPASVGVVSEPLIEEQGAVVLGDALKNVSGVNVQTQSGVADYFVVRGMDSVANGLVLFDGAIEPEISFYQLYNVERVEVMKGPAGFVYGANPLAGVVNLVRKQPTPGSALGIDLRGGSFGTLEGALDWNAEIAAAAGFRLNGLWQESDGWRDRTGSSAWSVNPAFSWRPGEATTWNVSFEQGESDFTPDAGLPVLITGFAGTRPRFALADVPRERNYRSPYDRSEQDLTRAQVDFQHQVSDRLTVRNKAYYRRLDWRSNGTIFNGVFPSQTTGRPSVSRTLLLLDDTQEFAGDQLEAVLAAGRHRILAGVEVARLADEFTLDVGFLPDVDLLDPVETAQGPVFLIPGQSMGADAETRVVAPYVVDQIALTDRFQLLLGGRFDALDYDDPRTSTERSDDKLSPMLGAVFTPAPRFSLYAHWGEAFAPPSTRVVGEREPEESTQAEVGAKAELAGGRVQTTVALYQLDRENVAIPDENGFTQQTGSQRSRGLELELAAALRPGLKALFSYAYTDAELTEFAERVLVGFFPPAFATLDRSGNAPAFAPEHIANVWLTGELPGGLGGALGARYLSEQFIAEDNLFALDEALVLDASLWWNRGPQRFSLNLKNLTDEEYETRGFGSTSAIPAAGFAIYGGMNYRIGL